MAKEKGKRKELTKRKEKYSVCGWTSYGLSFLLIKNMKMCRTTYLPAIWNLHNLLTIL
jgi:hypothetical protein